MNDEQGSKQPQTNAGRGRCWSPRARKSPPDEAASLPALACDRQRPRENWPPVLDGCCHRPRGWDPYGSPTQELAAPCAAAGEAVPKSPGVEPADPRPDRAGAPLAARRHPARRRPAVGAARALTWPGPRCARRLPGAWRDPRLPRAPPGSPKTPPRLQRPGWNRTTRALNGLPGQAGSASSKAGNPASHPGLRGLGGAPPPGWRGNGNGP